MNANFCSTTLYILKYTLLSRIVPNIVLANSTLFHHYPEAVFICRVVK